MDLSGLTWLDNPSVINTLSLILIAIVARFLLVRMIRGKSETLSDSRRRWVSVVQNTTILLALLGLVYIWSPQLSTFALSLTAFAVATVIATKEYLLCLMGGLYRTTASPFTIGDWIEVQGLRGEVLLEGILSTRLQELGTGTRQADYTGRILVVPNSVFLTHTIFNESYRKKYLHHSFTVTVEAGVDPMPILAGIRKRLPALCEDTEQLGERYWSMVRQRLQTELPSREPQAGVETTLLGKVAFVVTVFCATARAAAIEGEITVYILEAAAKAAAAK
ncbi:mechanosensitive ion channel family protein [uncultured Algimonas sp.]|uniref:mechanosensitive ion channel family protein n=1 Tax=uncultured Algimonas sp. TaxID=1547920 RepID=UPI0026170F5A|nr:mechanosensitive ion channel family protein [uncultured Algimonas sp.]